MKKISVLFFFLSQFGFAQTIQVEALLARADSLKNRDEQVVNLILDQVLGYAQETDNTPLRNKVLLKKVESLILFNHFQQADSILTLIEVDQNIGLGYIDYLMAKGQILAKKKEGDKALELFYDILEINNQQNINHKVAEIYLEIANVLRGNNDLENCTKFFRSSMNKAREDGNTPLRVKACTQLCKVYNGWITLDLDSSVYYGEKAISIAREANDEYSYANAISILAAPLIRSGQTERGLQMSKEALSYADKYNFSLQNRYYLISNQAFAFNDLKQYDSALFYMEKAGELRASSIDFPRLKFRILKAQGNFEEALAALEEYQKLYAETVKSRHQTNLSTIQSRYETNSKEQELAAMAQEAKAKDERLQQQQFLLSGTILMLVLLSGVIVLLVRQRKLNKKQLLTTIELEEARKRLDIEKQYRASELKAIRSQMNPHFVFNALNSIQEYIMTNEKNLAGKYLGKFADLMRVYLDHSQVKEVSIEEEITAMRLYLDLEKMRFEDKLEFNFSIDDQLDLEAKIPSLMGQPYVENAIKHGLLHRKDNRRLIISFSVNQKNELIYSIEDNGIGREESTKINKVRAMGHRSFATNATRSRLELLNEERERPIIENIIDLKSDNEALGTRIVLNIPLN
ncbi:MAG: histidine kinase [Cytophagales bacterium]|nr:histidine kinase [Cytophagales bacterium]